MKFMIIKQGAFRHINKIETVPYLWNCAAFYWLLELGILSKAV